MASEGLGAGVRQDEWGDCDEGDRPVTLSRPQPGLTPGRRYSREA